MSSSETTQAVRQYILESYLAGEDPSRLTSETPLVSGGILDSLALLDTVAFLEKRFDVEFEAHEAEPGNFETLASIEALVERKRAA